MTDKTLSKPWETLSDLIDSKSVIQVEAFIRELSLTEITLTVSRLTEENRTALFRLISKQDAAEILVELPEDQAADLIEEIPVEEAAEIVDLMPADEQANLLERVSFDEAEAILNAMPEADASIARDLLRYPADTAGGLMNIEYLAYPSSYKVNQVVSNLRDQVETYSDYKVQYVYVVSMDDRLIGVLRLRDLLLARGSASVQDIMISNPIHVEANDGLDKLIEFFEQHSNFIGIPVTNNENRLLGVVRRASVMEATGQRANRSFLKISGIIGGEEFRSMSLFHRSFRRLAWLAPNIVLNILAASVIALYQETLQAAIVLAVFLPIISDMSGCSGNQAVAVSIRELSLGLIRETEFLRVFSKESLLGVVNGIILGFILGGVAILWKSDIVLGVVIGSALALNTFLSVMLGGSVPLLLRRLKIDPALASGPLLTTVTDICGFFFVLSFASATL